MPVAQIGPKSARAVFNIFATENLKKIVAARRQVIEQEIITEGSNYDTRYEIFGTNVEMGTKLAVALMVEPKHVEMGLVMEVWHLLNDHDRKAALKIKEIIREYSL